MIKLSPILICVIFLSLLKLDARAAYLKLTPVDDEWSRITEIDITGMSYSFTGCAMACGTNNPLVSGIVLWGGSVPGNIGCFNIQSLWGIPSTCTPRPTATWVSSGTPKEIADTLIGVLLPASAAKAGSWRLQTTNGFQGAATWTGTQIVSGPPPGPSCFATDAVMNMTGSISENILGRTSVTVRCSAQTAVRLSIVDDGIVNIGNGGVVRLTFPANGQAAVLMFVENSAIPIDGVLHKAPSSPGAYEGTTVFRLDIL